MSPESDIELPLHGVRVLEFGHIVAGPTAGLILAHLGADVVKVEPPGGEQARGMGGLGAGVFPFLNSSKRSVEVDLKTEEGYRTIVEMVADADVVLSNYAESAAERLKIDYDSFSDINPRVVYGQVSGFSSESEHAGRPALDEVVQMMCGLAFMTGPAGRPLRAGASIVDIGAAMFLVIGIQAALRARDVSGEGSMVESTLYGTGLFYVGAQMATRQITGQASLPFPEHGVGQRFGWPVYDRFDTADGVCVFIGATSDRHWKSLATMLGEEALVSDERYANHDLRIAARDVVLPIVQHWVGQRSYDEVWKRLDEAKLPFAPVRSPDAVLDAEAESLDFDVLALDAGEVRVPRVPIGGAWRRKPQRLSIPRLGGATGWIGEPRPAMSASEPPSEPAS